MKAILAQSAAGRILLHLWCLGRGGNAAFHRAGVRREYLRLRGALVPRAGRRVTGPVRD